jgi:undecaprenyl-diphosphatase
VRILGTLMLNTAVKLVVRRPRPTGAHGHTPRSYSFPSAHSSMAVVGASAMTVLEPALAVLWWAIAALLAASRVLLGAHYLGDVVAGALLGALVATVAVPVLF